MLYKRAIRPLLFRAAARDAEVIHARVLGTLALVSRSRSLTAAVAAAMRLAYPETCLPAEVFGLRFPTPVGLAAGFDKDAVAVPALAALGFGFIEVGTVTHYPQPGNQRPRLFRLPSEMALINRMGFNNAGAEAVAARLAQTPRVGIPVGISLGKSRVTALEDAIADYVWSLDRLYPYGDYFAINVSSPNTPGLRDLQQRDRLDALLLALGARLRDLAARDDHARAKPLLVKVSPDLDDAALDAVVDVCLARGASGLIAVNTTLERTGLSATAAAIMRAEPGGLSGRPLFGRALAVVRRVHSQAGERLPIIGCGGIFAPDDAARMLDAGARLVQLYSAFIYEGPGVARRIATGLARPRPRGYAAK